MAVISGELITEPTEPLKPSSPLSLILNPDKPEPDEPELLTPPALEPEPGLLTPTDSEFSDDFRLTPVLPPRPLQTTHQTN